MTDDDLNIWHFVGRPMGVHVSDHQPGGACDEQGAIKVSAELALLVQAAQSRSIVSLKAAISRLQDKDQVSKRYKAVRFTEKDKLKLEAFQDVLDKKQAQLCMEEFKRIQDERLGLPSAVPSYEESLQSSHSGLKPFRRIYDEEIYGRIGKCITEHIPRISRENKPSSSNLFFELGRILDCPPENICLLEGTKIRFKYDPTIVDFCRGTRCSFENSSLSWSVIDIRYLDIFLKLMADFFTYYIDINTMEIATTQNPDSQNDQEPLHLDEREVLNRLDRTQNN